MARRARSKQAMQKLVTINQQTWGASDTFKAINLTPAGGFDDECIVKRIRVTIQVNQNSSSDDAYEPLYFSIVQTQTDDTPTINTWLDNNLVVATGIVSAGGGSRTYDHTITMRKLSGSAMFLCLSNPGTFSGSDVEHNVLAQLHYVES